MAKTTQKTNGKKPKDHLSLDSHEKFQFDLNFQRILVKLAIENEDWYDSVRMFVRSEFVEYLELSSILALIEDFYEKNKISPTYNVVSNLVKKNKLGIEISNELDEIKDIKPKKSEIEFAVNEARSFHAKQVFKLTATEMEIHIQQGHIDKIPLLLSNALDLTTIHTEHNGSFYFDNNDYDARYNKKEILSRKIPTLWQQHDEKMRGGITKKELGLIMMPPYRGKSAELVQLGCSALFAGKKVLHISLENSLEETTTRYDMSITNMTFDEIMKNKNQFIKEKSKVLDMFKGGLRIEEYPSRSLSVGGIKGSIKSLIRKYGFEIDILILDYVDELKRENNYNNESYNIGELVSGVRGLTSEFNIPMWSATQTNRGGFSKVRLDLDDVGDSWDKVKIADIIIAGCQTLEEEAKDVMRHIFLKNRNNKRWSKPIFMETAFERMRVSEK